ncbi:MAG: 5'-nucleotidase, lipoprotein e(P4) family [Candidatus Binatia bacterium]
MKQRLELELCARGNRASEQHRRPCKARIGLLRGAASLVGVVCVFLSACAMEPGPSASAAGGSPRVFDVPAADERLHATLWQQTSAEYRALAQSIYSTAKLQLERALADKQWTAEPYQKQKGDFRNLPPAVIMDIDETVLDTSLFQADLIKRREEFTGERWHRWLKKNQFPGVPGAVDFISFAQARGVIVFFVTGRERSVEQETRNNLRSVGISVPADRDTVLMRGEAKEWGADKASRRKFVADSHRVLLIIGDDLGDFISEYKGTPRSRINAALKHEEWGAKWLILPNGIYGSWVGSLYGFDFQLGKEEISRRKFERLDSVLD